MKTKELNKMMSMLENEKYWLNAMLKLGDINKRQAYRYTLEFDNKQREKERIK